MPPLHLWSRSATARKETWFATRAPVCVSIRRSDLTRSIDHNGIKILMNQLDRLASAYHSQSHRLTRRAPVMLDGVRSTCSMKTILNALTDYPADPPSQTQNIAAPITTLVGAAPIQARGPRVAPLRVHAYPYKRGGGGGGAHLEKLLSRRRRRLPSNCARVARSVFVRHAPVSRRSPGPRKSKMGADWRASSRSSRDACAGLARRRGR